MVMLREIIMFGIHFVRAIKLFTISLMLLGCQAPDFSKLKEAPASIFQITQRPFSGQAENTVSEEPISLGDILNGSLATENSGSDFASAIRHALKNDPEIIADRRDIDAKVAAIGTSMARKDFLVGTTFYGGIEDITDNTKGMALGINASRSIFDGGKIDSQIDMAVFSAEAAKMKLAASLDRRAFDLCVIWLELDKYRTLQAQINRRLSVLTPLIDQLEQVAKAGIGDVSKVTAAQRTVASIRVEQTRVAENLTNAELEFSNAFGEVSQEISFDYDFISNVVPESIDDHLIKRSPTLLAQYAEYQSRLVKARAVKAKDVFDIGFEAKAMRPFAGSEYDSDESVGLVGRKTLYNGGILELELKEAEALIDASVAKLQGTYRQGAKTVQTSMQRIKSMEESILTARENAKLTSDEIVYLRQQLIIGGSTLDSVLSAEARLYDAESKEIDFSTEKYKAQLVVASSLGLLGRAFGLQ